MRHSNPSSNIGQKEDKHDRQNQRCCVFPILFTSINRTGSHLEVVLLDHHLEVKPRELAQVPVRPRLLRSEHRPHLSPTSVRAAPSQHEPQNIARKTT